MKYVLPVLICMSSILQAEIDEQQSNQKQPSYDYYVKKLFMPEIDIKKSINNNTKSFSDFCYRNRPELFQLIITGTSLGAAYFAQTPNKQYGFQAAGIAVGTGVALVDNYVLSEMTIDLENNDSSTARTNNKKTILATASIATGLLIGHVVLRQIILKDRIK